MTDEAVITASELYVAVKALRARATGDSPIFLTRGGRFWVVLDVNQHTGVVGTRRILPEFVDLRNLVDLDAGAGGQGPRS